MSDQGFDDALFDDFDTNADGVISRREWHAAMGRGGANLEESASLLFYSSHDPGADAQVALAWEAWCEDAADRSWQSRLHAWSCAQWAAGRLN